MQTGLLTWGCHTTKNQRPEEKAPPKQNIEENMIATYYNYEIKEFLQKPVEWFDDESFEN